MLSYYYLVSDNTVFSDQTGIEYDEEQIDQIDDKLDKIWDYLEEFIENKLNNDMSLERLLNDEFEKKFKKFNPKDDIELIKAVFRYKINEERHWSACDNLSDLSAFGWNEYEDFDDEQYNRLKFGYIKLIDYLASFIPANLIKLNENVEKINWQLENDDTIKVNTYNNLDQRLNDYHADYVVCTIPLGVLKTNHTKLFNPILPNALVGSIERLGFGSVNKIFTVFDRPLNYKNFSFLQILWFVQI